MAEFISFDPTVQVVGEVIAAFVGGFPSEVQREGFAILKRHAIENPRPGDYYPLQSLLDAMKEVSEKMGSQMLNRIGDQIATNAMLPPGLSSLESCLAAIDVAYHMNHKGGDIGRYVYADEGTEHGLRKAKMVCPNPYPCAFDRGVIEGFARRFRPAGCLDCIVRHDDSQPCRREGADSCTYVIVWA